MVSVVFEFLEDVMGGLERWRFDILMMGNVAFTF